MQNVPQKSYYKLSEVCRYTDTQPYVLRFWETEFPQLKPERSSGGQPIYRKKDIDLVKRIKELLYEEEYTLAGARKLLDDESGGKKGKGRSRAKQPAKRGKAAAPVRAAAEPAPREMEPEPNMTPFEIDAVPRQRYQDAVDEIDHLRLSLKEAERDQRKAESMAEKATEEAERHRERAERAIRHLEGIVESLS